MWSALALVTPVAIVPTPISDTSFTLTREARLAFVPYLQAEEDRRAVAAYKARDAREAGGLVLGAAPAGRLEPLVRDRERS